MLICICVMLCIVALIEARMLLKLTSGKKSKGKVFEQLHGNDDVTEEEIISMVHEGHEKGNILASEVEMINNIFEFDDKEVKDIMTHRKNILSLDGSLSYIDAVRLMIDAGKSRFPVYENDIDNIIGVLHIKDAFEYSQRNEVFRTSIKDIKGLIKEADFVPETVNINDLFKRMQAKKNHLAMVIDEYGQISGIVAMEDILEELVGEIEDEHDEEEELIQINDDQSYYMDGMTDFSDVKETLNLPLEEDAFETLNGFLIAQMDKIPEEDEKPVINAYGYEFSVLSVNDNVIGQVMIKKVAPNKN
ncbi:MAG: hemolysin family protein [Lachnobacterium sp.]|nr:hemolysin family protein [Lachnobacterium sp.]MDD6631602.1 hemolysin family protein [Lachnobacterium sp.]